MLLVVMIVGLVFLVVMLVVMMVLCFSYVLLFFEDFPFFLFERKADLSWSAFASF